MLPNPVARLEPWSENKTPATKVRANCQVPGNYCNPVNLKSLLNSIHPFLVGGYPRTRESMAALIENWGPSLSLSILYPLSLPPSLGSCPVSKKGPFRVQGE